MIPNIFLAGFISCGLVPWLQHKLSDWSPSSVFCLLTIAAANFVTTIRPRHYRPGPDCTMAQCVAERTHDLFIAAQWGWSDYLDYVHRRTTLNLINESPAAGSKEAMLPAVKSTIASHLQQGGAAYMADPGTYSPSHLVWLQEQTGRTLDDLTAFHGWPAFTCSGTTINKLIQN